MSQMLEHETRHHTYPQHYHTEIKLQFGFNGNV